MPPVQRSEERMLYNGLKKLFQDLINQAKEGSDLRDAATQFMQSPETDSFLRKIVGKMVKNVRNMSLRSWRAAAAKGTNGRRIYDLIKQEMHGPVGNKYWEIIADNVAYIKTVPQEWANYITQYTARETLRGKRPEVVEAELRKKMPQHITKNLKTIARTECAKANAALVEARAEMCGLQCYFWRCVMDERSRESHMHMDGVLVFYDDPPNPEALIGERSYGAYHAGNTFNCRCYQEPVVDETYLPDVFKVHVGGRIYSTTRGAFLKQFGKIA